MGARFCNGPPMTLGSIAGAIPIAVSINPSTRYSPKANAICERVIGTIRLALIELLRTTMRDLPIGTPVVARRILSAQQEALHSV
jgi:hypothetical protein